jgi:hypothetical protein
MKKQVFYSLRFILLCCLLITGAVHLHGQVEVDGILYNLYTSGSGQNAVGDSARIIGANPEYTGTAIPESITAEYKYYTIVGYDGNHRPVYDWVTRYLTYRVTSMRFNAFRGSKISSFSAPDNIGLVDVYGNPTNKLTFSHCTNLKSAIVPSTATNLDSTFAYCSELTSVNIPNSVTSLNNTFGDCI